MKSRAAVLIALILLVLSAAVIGAQQKKRPAKKDLIAKKKAISKKAATIRTQLSKKKREKNIVMEDIHQTDSRLSDARDRLADTQQKLADAESEQSDLKLKLQEAIQKVALQEADLKRHLYDLYVNDQSSPVTVLLSAESFNEMAKDSFIMEMIAEQDTNLIADLNEAKRDIDIRKQKVDEAILRIQTLKQSQLRQQSLLKEEMSKKRALLSELAQDQHELQSELDDLEQDSAEVERMLERYYSAGGGGVRAFRGRLIKPTNGAYGSGFGMRFHPILHYRRMHTGVDIGAAYGSRIWAAGDGRVIFAGYRGGYGNCVMIDHGGGLATLYGHCSRLAVHEGQYVRQGELIAWVGSTGLSTGPHLHWEVRVNGKPVNPVGR